jgi:hypothetical protein
VVAVALIGPGAAGAQEVLTPPRPTVEVHVGSTSATPCHFAAARNVIVSPWPPQPSNPQTPPIDVAPPEPCRGRKPVRLHRARHLTVTLRAPVLAMGASWYERGTPTPLTVRPVGEPPSATWFLRLPPSSGKLILNLWYPVVTDDRGGVYQNRDDYRLAIRRPVGAFERS